MIKSLLEIGKCLLFIILLPLLIILSIPLGIYAFINYVIGVINTFRGKKPSIVTEFDQKETDDAMIKANPYLGENPYAQYMQETTVSNNTINSNNVTNSNNTTNANNTTTNNSTNYIFNNVNPFQQNQQVQPKDEKEEIRDEDDIMTFTPEDRKIEDSEKKILEADVKEVPLTDYRQIEERYKQIQDSSSNQSLPVSNKKEGN